MGIEAIFAARRQDMKTHVFVWWVVLAVNTVTGAGGGTISGLPPVFNSVDPLGDHSTRVTVTPQPASPSDDISVTVSRWVQVGYGVVNSTIQTQGNVIRLNVHWEEIYGVIAISPPPYSRIEHTVSIGKWNPGNYTLIVTNDGKDSAFARFTVTGDTTEPASSGGSLIEQLLGNRNNPSSGGESIIDRLRRLLSTSQAQ